MILAATLFANNSFAASQAECAIWLCVPTGFPSGCSSAKSAMIDRIKHFKSPLPSLSSCIVSAPSNSLPQQASNLRGADGKAAFIPAKTYCAKRTKYDSCAEWARHDAQLIKGESCKITYSSSSGKRVSPANCTKTYYYAEVYIDGQKTGETYYFDKNGNTPF